MTYTVEVLLRETHHVVTERLEHAGPPPAEWTDPDVTTLLKDMLRALDRVKNVESDSSAPVSLRGLSWIVTPFETGVAVALEIHSGTAVAGPFSIEQRKLETMIERVIADARVGSAVVH